MPTYFHVAPAAARDSIASEGLRVEGADYYEEQQPGVYAWTSETSAIRCLCEYEAIGEVPFEIWAIDAERDWPLDPLTASGVWNAEAVPPERLTLIAPAGWVED